MYDEYYIFANFCCLFVIFIGFEEIDKRTNAAIFVQLCVLLYSTVGTP